MSQLADVSAPTTSPSELRAVLEPALNSHFGVQRSITRLDCRPSDKRSSFALEEIDLCLEDGASLKIMFKNLSRNALLEGARQAKPAFLHDPLRETEIYRAILAPHRMGTADYYGGVVDTRASRYWLFLEKVAGVELYQVGGFAIWLEVARYLAILHTWLAAKVQSLPQGPAAHLLTYDAEYFRQWLIRAQQFLQAAGPARRRKAKRLMERLAGGYERVIERLVALPATLIHGEFYASNVLVQESAESLRVCPVDWEMAGIGPSLIDLAAVIAGRWTAKQKKDLALAYHASLPADNPWRAKPEAMLTALEHCRLHLAIQWLGWSSDWSPPPEHKHNWLTEAIGAADRLGL
ncbi:MAG: phosphotransferase family protein [Gemmataceae bacterium]